MNGIGYFTHLDTSFQSLENDKLLDIQANHRDLGTNLKIVLSFDNQARVPDKGILALRLAWNDVFEEVCLHSTKNLTNADYGTHPCPICDRSKLPPTHPRVRVRVHCSYLACNPLYLSVRSYASILDQEQRLSYIIPA